MRGRVIVVSVGSRPCEDGESLEEMLSAVARFLREARDPIKNLIDALMETIEGDRVARDVAAFYKRLTEEGLPEELARQLTIEYFRKRMDKTPRLPTIMGAPTLPQTLPLGKAEAQDDKEDKDETSQ